MVAPYGRVGRHWIPADAPFLLAGIGHAAQGPL